MDFLWRNAAVSFFIQGALSSSLDNAAVAIFAWSQQFGIKGGSPAAIQIIETRLSLSTASLVPRPVATTTLSRFTYPAHEMAEPQTQDTNSHHPAAEPPAWHNSAHKTDT